MAKTFGRASDSPEIFTERAQSYRPLEDKTVLLAVTGGIAAYKVADYSRQIQALGARVVPVMTKSAGQFVSPLTFAALTGEKVYTDLSSDHPIDRTRYQVINCYMGRVGLINSGGASSGASDLADAVRTAVINKRAGGMGLISGRKAFQRPMAEGVELLNAIQDVYLCEEVTIA